MTPLGLLRTNGTACVIVLVLRAHCVFSEDEPMDSVAYDNTMQVICIPIFLVCLFKFLAGCCLLFILFWFFICLVVV